jgi:glycosyltransferase involved in cell wall biosynthesis
VGNDTIPGPKGHPWREVFEADEAADAVRARVAFHGEVSESRLRGFYQACDIFVAPSRFESFGLMLVEGMMFGKPVIGGNAGGMVEVVENGQTGLLAEPGDDASLQACLERLIEDADLRARMGIAARRRYEHEFTAKRMAADVAHLLARVGNELSEVKMSGHRSRSIPAAISLPTVVESTANRPVTSKAVIVAPLLARYDAISAAARDTYRMLASALNLHTTVLTYRNDFPDVPAHTVSGVGDLLTHPAFLEADLIIYHFGIYNELCNALIVGNGKARQVVQFHNITPARFVSSAQVQLIKESFRQISNLQYADEVWSDSDVNTEVLKEHGIARERIQAMPLAVDEPGLASLSDKRESPLELLFIGRIVPAKGVLDLVQAVDLARRHSRLQFRVQLAGSLEWSDQEYLRQVKDYVGQHRLDDIVQFCGAVDDRERERLFHAAHVFMIPSYHEGFCKPVIEALRSGCIPVGYASYNLPPITNGFGRLVAPGDIGALAGALVEVLEGIATAMRAQDEPALPLDHGLTSLRDLDAARRAYVEQFTFDRLASMRINRVRALLAGEETLFPDPEFWEVDYNVHRRLALPSS